MIPQAIKSTGPYADLWSHLKSMAHALTRVESARDISEVAPLDKARLHALDIFIGHELGSGVAPGLASAESFLSFETSDLSYSLEVDVRALLTNLPSFREWMKGASLEDKTAKVVKAVDTFSEQVNTGVLPADPPKTELNIVRDLLSTLVLHTESALAA